MRRLNMAKKIFAVSWCFGWHLQAWLLQLDQGNRPRIPEPLGKERPQPRTKTRGDRHRVNR